MEIITEHRPFVLTVFFNKHYHGFIHPNHIPSFIKSRLKDEDYVEVDCPTCDCGNRVKAVTKERIEEVIALLASERIALLN